MKIIELVGENPRTYTAEDNMTIEQAATTYGRTEDSIQMYDDGNNLISYAAWEQGNNHYSFCHKPTANFPCDWDILR